MVEFVERKVVTEFNTAQKKKQKGRDYCVSVEPQPVPPAITRQDVDG